MRKFLRSYYKPFTSLKLFKLSLISFIPIVQWLPHYNWKENLLPDVIGGLTVGVMHVPQGIAYALLAKQEAVIGLYTSMFPSLIYMVFGTSRHNSIGTFAVASLMTGLAVDRLTHVSDFPGLEEFGSNVTLSTDNLPTPIEVASALTILIGVIQFCLGVLRLSFITTYFSDQVVSGFTTGASCHVFVSQLKDAFGLRGMPSRSGPGYLFLKLYDIAANFNRINWAAVIMSVISIAFLVVGKDHINPLVKRKFKTSIPLPFEFILVIAGTTISYLLDMNRIYNVRIVHHIPPGLPGVSWPRFSLMPDLITNGLGISVVVLAIHISLAKMFAKKLNYEVDPGQEMYAMGLASIGSGFFPVMPNACSLGRTIVSVESGTRTQLSTIFSIMLLISVIAYFGKLLETLPMCILSAIVIVALKGMLNNFKELRTLWPLSKIDFVCAKYMIQKFKINLTYLQ
uniref:Sulfate_transp domain-containing protein n=1 Tax=Angiostrongylus cantonensis TaxID=6313 RepID=A0A0K0D500_ANGCA